MSGNTDKELARSSPILTSIQSNLSQLTTFKSTPIQYLRVGQELKTLSVIVPSQGQFAAGALTRHVEEWSSVTDNYVALQTVRGAKGPLTSKPPVRRPSRAELDEQRTDPVIDEAIKVVSTQD